ncbi:MAG: class 1 fructose-bisphosphatase [Vicingaceae bacterium]
MQKLSEFIESQVILPCDASDLNTMFESVARAAVKISAKVMRAGILDVLGSAGAENIQGEVQQKLDVLADEILIKSLGNSGLFAAAASEENEEIVIFEGSKSAPYVIAFDPLDGSSNIDVNVSIGTIFTIFRRVDQSKEVSVKDFFQAGDKQLAAGYVIYGTSTMMVMSTGNGLNAFTLNPDESTFYLTHADILIPKSGRIFSINEGNYSSFHQGLKRYIGWCKSDQTDLGSPYSARYIGSMVADIHRNFLKGGLFLYPPTTSSPNGKLRLLYECMPMAFLAENAGGKASTGLERILDLQVEGLHQRCPIYIGSANMVEKVINFLDNPDMQ